MCIHMCNGPNCSQFKDPGNQQLSGYQANSNKQPIKWEKTDSQASLPMQPDDKVIQHWPAAAAAKANTSGQHQTSHRKGGWYGWKPSSSSNFSIRAFRACPLIYIKQFPVEQFEATVSQSRVPSHPLQTGTRLNEAPTSVRRVKALDRGAYTANLRTWILDLGGFGSSRVLVLRGGILMSIGNSPESLSQAILAGIILAGRLGASFPPRFPQSYNRLPCFKEPFGLQTNNIDTDNL